MTTLRQVWLERESLRWPLRLPRVVLGRTPGVANIVVNSSRTSRVHCELVDQGPDRPWLLIASPSASGTFVTRPGAPTQKILRFELADGDRLLAGEPFEFHDVWVPLVDGHNQTLDGRVFDPAAWQVWVDALLERGDPLGQWMISPKTTAERDASLGSAFFHPGRRHERWNRFGFLEEWSVSAAFFLENPTCFDPVVTPAVRFASTLEINVEPLQIAPCIEALREAPLPRALRWLTFVYREPVASPNQASITETLRRTEQRCPFFSTAWWHFD